jgi:serine/threonine-protein kinase
MTQLAAVRSSTRRVARRGAATAVLAGLALGLAGIVAVPTVAWAASYGSQVTLPFTGLDTPNGIAVDAAGDVYVADTYNSRVVELPAGCTKSSCQTTLNFGGLSYPLDVGVDSAGDVFAMDYNAVDELPSGCAVAACQVTLPFGALTEQTGMAVDAAGDVYVADDTKVLELPTGCDTSTA